VNDKNRFLKKMATKYRWWETPREALSNPQNILAAVMNLGTIDDIFSLTDLFEPAELLNILEYAVIGQFNEKSWHFWHYRLMDIRIGEIPPLPENRTPIGGKREYHENM
jgi:hypothetical protein